MLAASMQSLTTGSDFKLNTGDVFLGRPWRAVDLMTMWRDIHTRNRQGGCSRRGHADEGGCGGGGKVLFRPLPSSTCAVFFTEATSSVHF
jgi:hypothetical protein